MAEQHAGTYRTREAATTTIAIEVPARSDQLIMIRALTETLSLIADFAIDEVTDIRLALDEVATALILDAVPGTTLELRFTYDHAHMCVRAAAVSRTDSASVRVGFGWHIVRTLTQTVTATHAPRDPVAGGYPLVVEFDWVRAAR